MRPQKSPMGKEENGRRKGEVKAFHFYLGLPTAIALPPEIPNSLLSLCLYVWSLYKDIK